MKKPILFIIHGGPGIDDSYFYPYLNDLRKNIDIVSYCIGNNVTDYNLKNLQQELEEKLLFYAQNELHILAHSFGSVLALNLNKNILDQVKTIFLVNWIYDNEWINSFYQNNPEERGKIYSSLKESFLCLNSLYFLNTEIGEQIFNKINYNEPLFEKISPVFDSVNLISKVKEYREKIVSISSKYDRITTHEYLNKIALNYNLKSIFFENSGHFPFIEESEEFNNRLSQIILGEKV